MSELKEEKLCYGCLFCTTGKERLVAQGIEVMCPGVRTLIARQEKHKTVHGRKFRETVPLLPGYVFFQAEYNTEPYAKFPREHVLRLLTTGENRQWQLAGEDEKFAAWLFRCDGLLGFSKAYKEQDKIRIVSGPLKDLEGQILRIDRRGRSGQVALEFNGRQVKVWLGFELIDAVNDQTQIMLPGESGSPDRHDVPEGTDEDNQEATASERLERLNGFNGTGELMSAGHCV